MGRRYVSLLALNSLGTDYGKMKWQWSFQDQGQGEA